MWCRVWLFVALSLCVKTSRATKRYNLTVGYLPCNTGEARYKQGLTISGALSIALQEINNSTEVLPDVELLLDWHDTACDPATTSRLLTDMLDRGVVAYFGPERYCHTAATIAHSRNLPLISYSCADYNHETTKISNFIQIDPTAAQATKSVLSLLRYYRWNKFAVVYEEDTWTIAALTLENHAKKNNMTANLKPFKDSYTCCQKQLSCCTHKYLFRFVQQLKNENRSKIYIAIIYHVSKRHQMGLAEVVIRLLVVFYDIHEQSKVIVYLGTRGGLINFMTIMEVQQLLANGKYMVIFVNMMVPSVKEGLAYLMPDEDRASGFQCPNTASFKKRAQSLFVVTLSEPSNNFQLFASQVERYDALQPFNFPHPFRNKYISIYAAYLYDSVKLYAQALDELIKEATVSEQLSYNKLLTIATNGTRIANKIIKGSPYSSISGAPIRLSESGEAEGSFVLLAYKPVQNYEGEGNCSHDMVPVAQFQRHNSEYPEYKLNPHLSIDWAGDGRPDDEACRASSADESTFNLSLLLMTALCYTLFL